MDIVWKCLQYYMDPCISPFDSTELVEEFQMNKNIPANQLKQTQRIQGIGAESM